MTGADRLAEIKAAFHGAHSDNVYYSFLTTDQIRWLIAEVEQRRAQLKSARIELHQAAEAEASRRSFVQLGDRNANGSLQLGDQHGVAGRGMAWAGKVRLGMTGISEESISQSGKESHCAISHCF